METRYRNRKEAAEYVTSKGLRCKATTLGKLVTTGGGPTYYRFGHQAVYRVEDLDAWIEAKLGAPRQSSSGTRRKAADVDAHVDNSDAAEDRRDLAIAGIDAPSED